MARPVTLFTGQWADLPLSELAPLAKKMGFDGLELACWGDHFDVKRAAESVDYCPGTLADSERFRAIRFCDLQSSGRTSRL